MQLENRPFKNPEYMTNMHTANIKISTLLKHILICKIFWLLRNLIYHFVYFD